MLLGHQALGPLRASNHLPESRLPSAGNRATGSCRKGRWGAAHSLPSHSDFFPSTLNGTCPSFCPGPFWTCPWPCSVSSGHQTSVKRQSNGFSGTFLVLLFQRQRLSQARQVIWGALLGVRRGGQREKGSEGKAIYGVCG